MLTVGGNKIINTNMSNRDWKKGLLSTGLALEYQIMEFLNSKPDPYHIQPDYPYFRRHLDELKEFSIDLSARYKMNSISKCKPEINYLIECEYRSPDKAWLFVPTLERWPYDENYRIPISSIHCYQNREINSRHILKKFAESLIQSYKGIEYHRHTFEFNEDGINRGKNQLYYAIPNFAYESSDWYFDLIVNYWNDPNFAHVELICPVLITNAELRVLSKGLSIESVSSADSIEDISEEVDFLCLATPNTREFDNYRNEIKAKAMEKERKRGFSGDEESFIDDELIDNVFDRLDFELQTDSIIVCNLSAFEELTLMIENLAENIASMVLIK